MPDHHHLIIPFAASTSEAARQALTGQALPHLERLLTRLRTTHQIQGEETSLSMPHERALAHALCLPDDDGRTPWAAWHCLQPGAPALPGQDRTQAFAFVTPCQWQVSTDHVTLCDPQALALDEAASRALLAIVSPWFAEDGITLHYDQPTRWVAQGAIFDDLPTASLERVLLRDVRPWMPPAASARTLHRLHSEMQMLLYTHAFNETRSEQGLPPVNAFWVHGAGAWTGEYRTTQTRPTLQDDLRGPALREDWAAWTAAWKALDAGPLASLLQRAEQGQPVRLTLCGERGAVTLESYPRALWHRIQGFFMPQRFTSLHDQL